jgi:UDP-N-acetylmuramate--alanine ligase
VYAAREDPEPGVSGELVASQVAGNRARYQPDAAGAVSAVAATGKPGDLVLTMGAGDVTKLGPLIVAALRERAEAAT